MIITCPHCQTKYQVTYEAIGSAGRKVQCAHCQQAWQQQPLQPEEPPHPVDKDTFDALVEDALDEALEAEARAVVAEQPKSLTNAKVAEEAYRKASENAGKVDPAVIRSRQRAFSRPQKGDNPYGWVRTLARVAAVATLVGLVCVGYFGRVQVVDRFPSMDRLYKAVGLGVNVVGLDFTNVATRQSLRDGKEVLQVSAQIVGLNGTPAPVPPVVLTLIDSHGRSIYEWSVTSSARDLMAGERATFDTLLVLPTSAATRVRLSFGPLPGSRPPNASAPAPAAAPTEDQTAAPAEHTAAPEEHAAPAAPEHTTTEHH